VGYRFDPEALADRTPAASEERADPPA
jgi:hypothetical protein